MKMKRVCPICANEGQKIEHIGPVIDHEGYADNKANFSYRWCKLDDVFYGEIFLSDEEISSFYPQDYMGRNTSTKVIEFLRWIEVKMLHRKLENIFTNYGNGQTNSFFLDYGAGHSRLARVIHDRISNLTARSFDPYVDYIDYQDSMSLTFKDYESLHDVDLISMIHVIEHLQEPHKVINELRTKLRGGGLLAIVTPNISDTTFGLFGRFWAYLHWPYHLTLFSKKSLENTLVSHGFEIVASKFIFSGNIIAYSVDNLFKAKFRIQRRGHSKAYPLFVMLFSPFEYLLWRLRIIKSTQMIVGKIK